MRLVSLALVGLLVAVGAAGARVVTGTAGNDRLLGTPRADVLRGLTGSDVLVAGRGTDFLDGGPGRDTHDAGAGNDLIATSYDGARDVVRCGAGVDVVNADLPDAVTRDCELVGRRLSRDPYTTADAQHETEVEPDSFTFGRTTVATFQVGRRFDGAATNVSWAVTTNDGATWRSGLLPGLTTASSPPGRNARASDPVVAYDAAHATWLISTLALDGPTTRLEINRSASGALWSAAVTALEERAGEGIAFDKNWLACDNTPSSPFYGRCYLVYTHSADRDMLAVNWSTDGGATWSAPVDIGARPGVGVFPAIRPTGEVVVVYLLQGGGQLAIASSRTADGGATWGAPSASPRSTAAAGFRTSACSRCRAPRPIAPAACGRAGTTASPPAPRERTPCSSPHSPDGSQWSAPVAVTRGRNDVLPAIGIDAGDGPSRDRLHASARRGIDVERVESPGSPSTWSPAHDSRPGRCRSHGCRTRRRAACSPTTSRCTTPADDRLWSGSSPTNPSDRASARPSTPRVAESRTS